VTRLELFVRLTDGSGRVLATERDDPAGRRAIDELAFRALDRSEVASASVVRAGRVAQV
jgi:hypothetical protein